MIEAFTAMRKLTSQPVRAGRGWLWLSALVATLVMLPVLALMLEAMHGSAGLWTHLLSTSLPTAFLDTIILLAGVGIIAATVGTSMAWLVTAYDFRGRGILEWALLLPLAVPTYIIAYAYLDILHPIGPVQGAIRFCWGTTARVSFGYPISAP